MNIRRVFTIIFRTVRGVARLLARPMRADNAQGRIVIEPYRA